MATQQSTGADGTGNGALGMPFGQHVGGRDEGSGSDDEEPTTVGEPRSGDPRVPTDRRPGRTQGPPEPARGLAPPAVLNVQALVSAEAEKVRSNSSAEMDGVNASSAAGVYNTDPKTWQEMFEGGQAMLEYPVFYTLSICMGWPLLHYPLILALIEVEMRRMQTSSVPAVINAVFNQQLLGKGKIGKNLAASWMFKGKGIDWVAALQGQKDMGRTITACNEFILMDSDGTVRTLPLMQAYSFDVYQSNGKITKLGDSVITANRCKTMFYLTLLARIEIGLAIGGDVWGQCVPILVSSNIKTELQKMEVLDSPLFRAVVAGLIPGFRQMSGYFGKEAEVPADATGFLKAMRKRVVVAPGFYFKTPAQRIVAVSAYFISQLMANAMNKNLVKRVDQDAGIKQVEGRTRTIAERMGVTMDQVQAYAPAVAALYMKDAQSRFSVEDVKGLFKFAGEASSFEKMVNAEKDFDGLPKIYQMELEKDKKAAKLQKAEEKKTKLAEAGDSDV